MAFDHRKYQGTVTGRTPRQPNPHRELVTATDVREIEIRVLAQMLDESPGKIEAALKNLEARGLLERDDDVLA